MWIAGAVVEADEARVPVLDRGFLYGDSVYEVTRTYGMKPFALDEHFERMAESARRIGLVLPPRAEMAAACEQTVQAVGGECYLRIVVTRGAGKLGLDPALADTPRLLVIGMPLALPDVALYRDGADVIVARAHRRNAPGAVDPLVKSGNYLPSVLAVAEARARGGYEAILLDGEGRVAEGSSSNIFIARAGRLVTPPLSAGILEGITRRHVIALARSFGIAVDELAFTPEELAAADEAFLTSSVRGVMAIRAVDGVRLASSPGPLSARLRAAYEDAAQAA